MVATDSPPGYEATLCNQYRGNGFADWYLQSDKELFLLFSMDSAIKAILNHDDNPLTLNQHYELSIHPINDYCLNQCFILM
jgi:hypothetical protein